jgi:hypothetical protein
MKKISQQVLTDWLDQFKAAWENKDPLAATNLFTSDAEYFESPFSYPLVGTQAILNYWQVVHYQENIQLDYEVIGVKTMRGFCKWRVHYSNTITGQMVELDGIFEIKFHSSGLCCQFKEWWHKEETPA